MNKSSGHKKAPVAPTTRALESNAVNDQENSVMTNHSTAVSNVIPFRQAKLLLVDQDGEPFVPMKPIVEGMGLAWQTQHRKLVEGRFASTITIMVIVAEDGKNREMACLPLKKLPGWLMSIHASKVRKDLRDDVLAFQNECDDVLWAYWNEGHAVNHRPQGQSMTLIGQTIGTDGFHCLGALLDGKVRQLPAKTRQRAKMHVWSQVHKAFSVVSAQDIPADQLDSARNFIAAYALEGEWIGKEEESTSKVKWPARRWLEEEKPHTKNRMTDFQGRGNMMLAYDMLYGPESMSPTFQAIAELEKQGHDLEACRFEVSALKFHLKDARCIIDTLRKLIENSEGKGIRFAVGVQEGAA
ncbi:P22 AR-like protein [Pseudomonas asplenii]|uniref:p22 AR-like protein n=1 Tax=Pseudomonas asplenii TaxID=53407 RepID=A0A0M9GC40_9PSED|nr:phage antirepressor N-terminal domain-containing protein [Pseudomonas fuscovaginae]KPA87278.1 P22 AR-like protein [Pseudomonas fuscovaginae]